MPGTCRTERSEAFTIGAGGFAGRLCHHDVLIDGLHLSYAGENAIITSTGKTNRPDQVFLHGGFYGGYVALLGLSKYPDLWAGGMAGMAITDWAVQYEDSAEILRGLQCSLLGGAPEEAAGQYVKSSPVTYAEQVQAPIYIIQGRNDTRTPARPVEQYEAKMKALEKDITVHWYDTGHTGSGMDVELSIDHQERFLRFAYRILGEFD